MGQNQAKAGVIAADIITIIIADKSNALKIAIYPSPIRLSAWRLKTLSELKAG
jgi:hypothetical protein